jgi:MFS family permease
LSLGGEYGTSATYLSEVATPHRRGFYSSFQYVTLTSGQLLALGVQIVLQQLLTPEQLHSWGWRIAFVIGAAAAVTVMWLRRTLRMLDIGGLAVAMTQRSGYPYLVRRVPSGGYVPPGLRSIGVPDLLLCRQGLTAGVAAAVVGVLANDAPQLVPPYVRGLQYLAPPSMIQTGRLPLHPGAVSAYRKLHG